MEILLLSNNAFTNPVINLHVVKSECSRWMMIKGMVDYERTEIIKIEY